MYQLPQKEQPQVGQIISPQKRNEIAREFKKSHFTLGGNGPEVMRSHTQTQFVPYKPTQNAIPAGSTTRADIQGAHFHFGAPGVKQLQTTNAQSFRAPPEGYKAVQIDAATKADLRKSHWNFGGWGQTLVTTNARSYDQRSSSVSQHDQQQTYDKIALMRGHHFNFGNQPLTYETTNGKTAANGGGKEQSRFKDVGPPKRQDNGLFNIFSVSDAKGDLRKHHFNFGNQSSPMTTTNQLEFPQKSPTRTNAGQSTKAYQNQTSIQFGDGVNYPMTTSTQLEFKPHQAVQETQDANLKKNLRGSHFQLGQHPPIFDSVNQGYGNFRQPEGSPQNSDLKKKLLQSQIQIGDRELNGAFFQTTYKIYNDQKSIADAQPTKQNNKASFQSSFQLGGSNATFYGQPTSQTTYVAYGNAPGVQQNQDFKRNLKANHFALSHTDVPDPLHYKTTHQNQFYEPGNPEQFRGQLNQEKKADLRRNHFEFSHPGTGMLMQSTNQAYFNAPMASTDNKNIHNNALALKHQSVKLNGSPKPGGADYVTNNQMAFKWVQPEFVNE